MSGFKKFEKIIKYNFSDQKLLVEALTHKSCKKSYSNERLEFLGDAVLDLIVGEYLFTKFKDYKEGALSKIRASLVNESAFYAMARMIKIEEFILLSSAEDLNGGRLKPSILSNAFEALMGAIYLDSNINTLKEIFYPILFCYYESQKEQVSDYKSALQELTQERFLCTPTYNVISESGPDHDKTFSINVAFNNKIYAQASAKSKKQAQQICAKQAFFMLKDEGK